jgi:hypothetical protein
LQAFQVALEVERRWVLFNHFTGDDAWSGRELIDDPATGAGNSATLCDLRVFV